MYFLSLRGGRISIFNGGKGQIRQFQPVSLYVRDWAKKGGFVERKNHNLYREQETP